MDSLFGTWVRREKKRSREQVVNLQMVKRSCVVLNFAFSPHSEEAGSVHLLTPSGGKNSRQHQSVEAAQEGISSLLMNTEVAGGPISSISP